MIINHVLKNNDEIITSNYGSRSYQMNNRNITDFHNGIDLVSKSTHSDHVIAFDSGIVTEIRNNISGFSETSTAGNYVYIDHGNNYQTKYLHLQKGTVKVKVGDRVQKGDILGYTGQTGWATGIHLHFGIYYNGQMQDPLDYLLGNKSMTSLSATSQQKYRVVKGDTLSSLAIKFNTTIAELVNINNISNPDLILVGQILTLPQKSLIYFSTSNYQGNSIVDALKSINVESNYSYRQQIANKNNISNYSGSASQNTLMLKLLRQGKLLKP